MVHYQQRDQLFLRELDGEQVVYDQANDQVLFLNSSATLIFGLCDGRHSAQDMVDTLLQTYEVDPAQATADVERTLASLVQQGVVLARADGQQS